MKSLVVSLIIPLLIWGPFFPDLIVSLSSIIFLIYIIKNKETKYINNNSIKLFLSFCFYCVFVSVFLADDIILSLESSLFYFRIGIFSCVIWFLIENDKKILDYFYYALTISFSVLVIDGYFQYFNGYNVFGFPHEGGRISSLFGDELIMGSYLSRLFPLLFALFVVRKKNYFELYYIATLFILIDILIYLSGERTAFLFLNLSTIFIIILINNFRKFRLVTFIIGFVIISLITLNSNTVKHRMITQTQDSLGLSESSNQKYIFSQAHDSLIRTAFNMFLDKPLFGHGPKMFRIKCNDQKYSFDENSCMTHPHNFYIQLLAETGIIGFLYLSFIFCFVIYCAFKQIKTILFKEKKYLSDYQVCLLAGILITVWPLSPNGNFFNNWLAICYSLPVGFYLHSIYGKNKYSK